MSKRQDDTTSAHTMPYTIENSFTVTADDSMATATATTAAENEKVFHQNCLHFSEQIKI